MSADDGPISSREVAWRLFAAEFEDADLTFSEADEERAPNYVITPTGARVNRLFVVGVLTEVEAVGNDILRGRVVDPTGAYVIYAGQYQPEAKAFLQGATPPTFVAVTGKARTFQPDDSDVTYTSIRPESINEVDAATRDRWTVQTAEHTLHRVATFDEAISLEGTDEPLEQALLARGIEPALASGIALARGHYGTTRSYLGGVRDVAIDAARMVAGEIDAGDVGPLSWSPGDGTDDERLDLAFALPGMEREPGAVTVDVEQPAAQPPTDSSTSPDEPATVEATTGSSAGATATLEDDSGSTAAPTSTTDSKPDPVAETEPDVEAGVESEPELDAEAEPASDSETADVAQDDQDDELDDFDGEMYELDEEERAEIEANYPTEFSSGSEIGEPGEAGIETPGPDEPVDTGETEPQDVATEADAVDASASTVDETEPEQDVEPEPEAESEAEPESEPEAEPESEPETADVEPPENLTAALMGLMRELNEGSGVPRDELFSEMASRFGADEASVEEALDGALMGGECYESGENTYTPI